MAGEDLFWYLCVIFFETDFWRLILSFSSLQDKDLPWASPAKSLSLNLDGLKGAIKGGGEVV